MQWKSWKVMPDEIKTEVHGPDLHHQFQAYNDPQVTLQEGCPKELEGREDCWAWLCAHFQAPDFVNKAKVNKGNRNKKTLLHYSGSRLFSYRMDARQQGGSKFPEIDGFGDVYVLPENELVESLHTMIVERSQLVLQGPPPNFLPILLIESVNPPQDAEFQILTKTLDQTLGRRPGIYCRGMGNAPRREPRPHSSSQSNSHVTALTAKAAELQGQMSGLLESLARSGIPVPHFDPLSTSKPVHPEHGHQTSAPVDNVQTSEPHLPNDQVDFGTLFD
ncbi:unnamed protein product [Prunus brigantina]